MANKNILLGMLAITLVFGLTLMGCGEEDNPFKQDEASFIGEWTGTFTPSEENQTTARIVFTNTKWTLTAVGINQTGTYEKSILNSVTLKNNLGYLVGSATIVPLTGTLSLNILQGTASGSGSFTRAESNTGEFTGKWTGTFTPKDGEETAATIEFEAATWTLIYGTTNISINGTYTQLTSETANLMKGVAPIGLVVINPLTGNLTLTFSPTAETQGSGNFKSGAEDSFEGTWTGTYKPSEGNDIEATITFTKNTWSLTGTGLSQSGKYEMTSLLPKTATASLEDNNGYTVGTANVIPLVGLKVNIIQGTASGSGSFTRAP